MLQEALGLIWQSSHTGMDSVGCRRVIPADGCATAIRLVDCLIKQILG